MRWILEFIVRYRVLTSLFLTSIASLWMITSPPRFQAKTARLLTCTVFYPFQVTIDQITNAKNIYVENKRLKNDLALLNARVAQLEEQAAENARLRDMLDFEPTVPYTLIPARVVARDPSPIFKSLVVDAGKNKGVLLYMPVVSRQGVVGKVVQVMPYLSLVQLIRDPLNHLSIMIRRNRTVGILENGQRQRFLCPLAYS